MFEYPKDVNSSKEALFRLLDELKLDGYEVKTETYILNKKYEIDKIIINKTTRVLNRVVISSGLHGIEGYIGHVCQMHFLKSILNDLNKHTQVILYHIINPYGMDNYRRFNHHNVDLNRNYSKNEFKTKNPDFLKVHRFLSPRRFRSIILMNAWFYINVIANIIRHSVATMNLAILKGQKIDDTSIYYSGNKYEESTTYILSELDKLYSYVENVVWIDIHSGYGKKYQLSVINSRFETAITKKLKDSLTYRDIMGYESDTLYDTAGDITEKLYEIHHQKTYQSDLLALCYEFGTLGTNLFSTLRSFKAVLFENGTHHYKTDELITRYSKYLMRRTFLPDTLKWKTNAITKFDSVTREILQYKKLI